MRIPSTILGVGSVGLACIAIYRWRRKPTAQIEQRLDQADQSTRLLTHAAPLLRLPTAPHTVPEVLPNGRGLRCPRTGRIYPFEDGVLNLLEREPALTATQRFLDTPLTAWAYDHIRDRVFQLFGGPSFAQEVARTQAQLHATPGATLLDLACGHGNFTAAWAERVGETGLIIGLDLSAHMLRRAAQRLDHAKLTNVLLIRGDAQHLPFTDHSFTKINCSGGFHQLPDLAQAVRELSRIAAPGATVTASTFIEPAQDRWSGLKRWLNRHFKLHFVRVEWLTTELVSAGFHAAWQTAAGNWFGYVAAHRGATGPLTADVNAGHSSCIAD